MGELESVMFIPRVTNRDRIKAALTIAERVPRAHVAVTLAALGLAVEDECDYLPAGEVDDVSWWQELRHDSAQALGAAQRS